MFWLVGIIWRSLQTWLFHRGKWLIPNSWQSQYTLAADEPPLSVVASHGEHVNVGRERLGKEGRCLSTKTEADRKIHPFLRIWRWCHIWSSWMYFLYHEAYWFERAECLEQGSLVPCHASALLYAVQAIYATLFLFCLHCFLALMCMALQREALGLLFGNVFRAWQHKIHKNMPLEGICTSSQL